MFPAIGTRALKGRTQLEDIETGKFTEDLKKLKTASEEELKKIYTERKMEPAVGPEDWIPDQE